MTMTPEMTAKVRSLSGVERDALLLFGTGMDRVRVGDTIGYSPESVDKVKTRILTKLSFPIGHEGTLNLVAFAAEHREHIENIRLSCDERRGRNLTFEIRSRGGKKSAASNKRVRGRYAA